ncbi:hypothetical protein H072_274 [Dactylellina haptotyla CBS 200.50]|uniref:Uncharacterized protein n=1 Tax=Dactylellina haptotyla (strain CBS 200.50) TaxID=1284197 RepID=S8ASD2_DACHA|nr:hypothetical protein H072_274 [Dactylellina haptotyla CBS 200.50]
MSSRSQYPSELELNYEASIHFQDEDDAYWASEEERRRHTSSRPNHDSYGYDEYRTYHEYEGREYDDREFDDEDLDTFLQKHHSSRHSDRPSSPSVGVYGASRFMDEEMKRNKHAHRSRAGSKNGTMPNNDPEAPKRGSRVDALRGDRDPGAAWKYTRSDRSYPAGSMRASQNSRSTVSYSPTLVSRYDDTSSSYGSTLNG